MTEPNGRAERRAAIKPGVEAIAGKSDVVIWFMQGVRTPLGRAGVPGQVKLSRVLWP